MKGWERVIYDKCKRNSVSNVQTINMPINYPQIIEKSRKSRWDPECDTFVYAAYVPPGWH